MRTVTYRLADLCKIKAPIPLGFAGENLHTRVQFDCKRVFDEYPGAVPSMTVQPPKGEAYPVVIVRDGDIVTWDVTDADLCYEGTGEIQLAFVDDEVVVKSYICTTRIDRSLVSGGEPPTPIKDWIAYANTVLAEIPGDIDDALQEAKDSGEFDGPAGPQGEKGDPGESGEAGVSPTVSVETITGGHQLTVTDAEGDHTFSVMDGADGADGQDGVSPQVTVTKEGGTATITITDATGTTTQTISDGATGPQGPKGDTGDPAPAAFVTTAVDAYLAENFSNPSNPPLDRTLSSSLSAAPADIVGNLKNEITALDYWQKEFISSGGNHSQTEDNATVDIKQGETFYIRTTTPNVFNCTPYAFYSDGTNESLGQTKSNALCQYVANKNIISVGIYIGPQSGAYAFDFVVALDRSAILYELANTEEFIKNEIQLNSDGVQSFYPYARFANGGLKTTGLFEYTQPYRVSCVEHIKVTSATTVRVKSGYRWGYIPFVNGTPGSWVGWKTGDYTIPENTEFVVQIAKATEDTTKIANIMEYVTAITFSTKIGETNAIKQYSYVGEQIPSKRNTFDAESFITMSYSNQTPQDMDIFGDYLFVAFSGTEEIKVYSLNTKSLVTSISVNTEHGSGMQFSGEYYDEGDDFPLLYVGGWTSNIINVIRLSVSGSSWSATVVKTLYIPTEYGYFASPNVDPANNILYTYALHGNSVSDSDYRIMASWDLNKLTDNGDETYTPAIINQCKSPNLGIYQGHKYYGGRIYITTSATSSPYNQKMFSLDCGDGSVTATVDLSNIMQYEMEGLCYRINGDKIEWFVSDFYTIKRLMF